MTKRHEHREFDLVVWGATGFTGALVVEYLLSQYGTDKSIRWAIAGRDQFRLDRLKLDLGVPANGLKTILADSLDIESLQNMARRTQVMLTTVGPYARFGSQLVAACVQNGTHYCDLAGEVHWIRRMIDEHQEQAAATGARIVHCCGFDSVPMDMGVWFLQDAAKKQHGSYCTSITTLVRAMRGSASGGTVASMLNVVRESRADRTIARILADPYSLNPAGQRQGPDRRDQQSARFDSQIDSWTAPFVMAGVNTRVVRRSNALQGFPYGRDFRYREAVIAGKGLGGRARAAGIALGLGGFVFAASFEFTRKLLQRFVLPEPGEGPDRASREAGFFSLLQIGVLPDGTVMRGNVKGDRDPGYGSTSKMISECAVCLALDEFDTGGGLWTPAASMGQLIINRLQTNAGLTFELTD